MAREGKAKVLTEAEFKRLLIVAKNSPMSARNVAMIFCSFGLGLRSKEICSLSIKDIADSSFKLLDEINLKRNMTKGEKQRAVYLSNKKINASNLIKRIWEHKNKLVDGFTKKYSTNILVYFEEHSDPKIAITREKQLKAWKRSWKLELIEKDNPNWNDLYDQIIR